ncbi:hypothetical protein F8388_012526 [Cannabis sativa]|uniref:RNase H type-1 domain-containing protein n=1 Tax=Cannabis sativa TaxID=3483 RepID=A0A7J6F3T4_CANSA|nr:hypothetical protein G4B88_014924 [Cannabis sativa]KAF4388549.1 hypothetical protein F8388_012526 [Cannabis sativa]
MEGIWFRLGFLNGAAVSSGASGGLALFWRRSWDIHVIESDFNKILVRFGGNGNTGDWVGCFTYAPPRRDARMVFWRDLCATMGSFTDPWIVMGDLNSVLSPDDKSGGRPVSRSEGQGLREFMFNLGAVDLESGSVLFTWTNGKDLDRLIRERLDRVVVSSSWLFLFKKVGVRNLPIHFSDHGAITLDTHMERENVVTPFRYLDAWSRDPDRRRVIEEAWREAIGGFHSFIPCQKLSFTAKALKVWNANVFGHCQTKIKALEKLLCEVQKRPPSNENAKDGRYLSLKAWDSLCKPKSCGGLGFRRAEDINFCLLAKFGWTLASKQTCLWKSILLDRYYHETAFGDSVLPSNASPVAKSIWATKDFIVKNSVWLIGREAKVKIGNHQWSGFDGDLIDSGFNPSGRFSLKSAYWALNNSRFEYKDDVCKRIWKTRIHERLKLFLWRLAQDVLPFGSKLASIFGPNIGRCMLCGLGEMDVVSHFVSGCDVTRSLWFSSLWGLRIQRFNLVGSREVVSLLLEPRFLNDCGGKILNEFFLYGAILYHKLWNVRNDIFHNKGVLSLAEVRKAIDLSFAEHKPLLNVGWDIESNQRGICAVRWGLPRPARMRCYVDFASARDDGAVAAVSYDVAGDIFVAVASKVRVHSVLQGELEAVRFGLNMAALLEVDVGTFFSDN